MVEEIKKEVLDSINEYKETSNDHYDFWNEHIKYVYYESIELAKKYGADIEIVSLGALLHDIALIKGGTKEKHHIEGAEIARSILEKHNYPQEKLERVVNCVYNHRSSKNATCIEEICVCDADILAHFDNIPMLFYTAYVRFNTSINDIRDWMLSCFEKDYDDLSSQTKETFKDRYENIKDIVLGEKKI